MCAAPCRKCRDWLCNSLRPDFECTPCPRLERTPSRCNSCDQRQGFGCPRPYRFYEAKYAQDLADARRSDARSGIDCDPGAFERAIDTFQDAYGARFGRVFSLVVCDRGSEFADADRIERGGAGRKRLRLYYADPRQSQQKPGAERRHAELRRILPKGRTGFDRLTGRDMATCMSHVNSCMVGSMGWASPMNLARALFPKGLLDACGMEAIEPREASLAPSLVAHAMARL